MTFPATSTFQSATGPVDVTVTAHPETGNPHMVHLSTEAGLCAHFLVREWNLLNSHLYRLIEDGKGLARQAEDDGITLLDAAEADLKKDLEAPAAPADVTATQPFLPPADQAEAEGADA